MAGFWKKVFGKNENTNDILMDHVKGIASDIESAKRECEEIKIVLQETISGNRKYDGQTNEGVIRLIRHIKKTMGQAEDLARKSDDFMKKQNKPAKIKKELPKNK